MTEYQAARTRIINILREILSELDTFEKSGKAKAAYIHKRRMEIEAMAAFIDSADKAQEEILATTEDIARRAYLRGRNQRGTQSWELLTPPSDEREKKRADSIVDARLKWDF